MTTTTLFNNAAIIVDQLPGEYSYDDFWAMPDCSALRRLTDLLGEGSQVFLFLSSAFGDPHDPGHDIEWHAKFAAELKKAWGDETPPQIFVEYGHNFKVHGGGLDGPETSEKIFGPQTDEPDCLGRATTPTLVRIYGSEYWDQGQDGSYTQALCKAIIAELGPDKKGNPRALQLDPSPTHFDARMNEWLQRAGAKSDVYQQVVYINSWTADGEPAIESIATMPGS